MNLKNGMRKYNFINLIQISSDFYEEIPKRKLERAIGKNFVGCKTSREFSKLIKEKVESEHSLIFLLQNKYGVELKSYLSHKLRMGSFGDNDIAMDVEFNTLVEDLVDFLNIKE